MKVIFVVFTKENITVAQANGRKMKKYCFRTDDTVEVGEKLASRLYLDNMLVTDILDKDYKYYNSTTGSLSDIPDSTLCYPIKTLCIKEEDTSTIYAHKVE